MCRFLPLLLLVVADLVPGCLGWIREEYLDSEKQVKLHWTADRQKGRVVFELLVRSRGYVGLGLSPTGTMAGADMAVGWITDKGEKKVMDYWSVENGPPTLDVQQNWKLMKVHYNGSHMAVRVRRDLETADEHDVDIKDKPIHVIYAWHDTVPRGTIPVYHGSKQRGAKVLCLLSENCVSSATRENITISVILMGTVITILAMIWRTMIKC